MKNYLISVLFLVVTFSILSSQSVMIDSPDGNIKVNINWSGDLSWSATYKGKPIIEKSRIAMHFSIGAVWGELPKVINQSLTTIEQMIIPELPHKDAEIHDHANQLILNFAKGYQVEFRAYNDGLAYRFIDPSDQLAEVINERMDIAFPEMTTSLFPQEESMYSHNERLYLPKDVSEIGDKEFCSLPVLFVTPDRINILFTETGLHNYPCMFIEGNGDHSVGAIFPPYVLEAVPNEASSPDRNQILKKEANYIAKVRGPRHYPWRVFIISDEDKTLVESNLTYQLAEPCVLENTEWIQPGKVAWDWYNANNIFGVDFKSGLNTRTYEYYIDFAAANGIEYVILDEGWTKSTTEILDYNSDMDVPHLIQYGKEKDVGIILWVLWKPLAENPTEILEKYKSWGAKGIKVDFMQRSDQAMVLSYEMIAKEAARLELLVDYHGAFKPSGLRRKYPNLINYEGVKGSENNKWSADITPEHNVTIPYIRMAAGPMDYTPGAMINAHEVNYKISFERPMSLGTRCHQVAMYVVYEAPLQMMCESPSIYKREQETVDFITQIPTTWDETMVLAGEVGDYIVVARRKREQWYIGGMTDNDAREVEINLSFLDKEPYHMDVMKDGVNAHRFAQDYTRETVTITSSDKIIIAMASGGGWAAILRKE